MGELFFSVLRAVQKNNTLSNPNDATPCERAPTKSLFQDGVVDAWYWFEALSSPFQCKTTGADHKPCERTSPLIFFANGGGLLLLVWSSARATSLQKQFCLASVLTSRNK